jgi:hypothetical protein
MTEYIWDGKHEPIQLEFAELLDEDLFDLL